MSKKRRCNLDKLFPRKQPEHLRMHRALMEIANHADRERVPRELLEEAQLLTLIPDEGLCREFAAEIEEWNRLLDRIAKAAVYAAWLARTIGRSVSPKEAAAAARQASKR